MKTIPRIIQATLLATILGALTACSGTNEQTAACDDIKLGAQAWTYNRLSFVETLDECQKIGVKYLQGYRAQKLGGDFPKGAVFHHTMSPELREQVLALAKSKGVTITSYGSITGKDEQDWRQIFAFAKAMGLRDVAIEPAVSKWPEVLPLVIQLSKETGVRVGLHNHTLGIPAAEYLAKLDAVDTGKIIGVCGDTGHWARSGLDPVETLRTFEGRIVALHFKDLNQMLPYENLKAPKETKLTAHDVPWGTGATNAAGQLAELRRQKFNGIIYLEYERRVPPQQKFAEAALCVEWFRKASKATAEELLKNAVVPPGYVVIDQVADIKRKEDKQPWPAAAPLFKNDLSNAEFKPGSWTMENGVLTANGGGDIWTKDDYRDFALNFDFRCEKDSNSGVFLRSTDIVEWLHNSIEVQILQGDTENARHLVGSIFDCAEPKRQVEIEPGQWYSMTIICNGDRIRVYIDRELVTQIKITSWKEAGKNPDGSPNKFNRALGTFTQPGRIGFQYHNSPISYRNIVIEKL